MAQEGTYTSQQIRDAFAAHGAVADVVLRDAKKKSRRSACVVMASRAAAAAAAQVRPVNECAGQQGDCGGH